MRLNPLTARKLRRFREIKRGYYSFILLLALTGLSLFAELLINDKPLVIRYEGQLIFPTYGPVRLGAEFGLEGPAASIPVNYRDLQRQFREQGEGNFVILPLVPYNPLENSEVGGVIRASSPNFERQHYLGTDTTGRDILARLFYGFRTAILFSIAFTVLTYLIGIALGCMMGYFGGIFDLLFQRIIEIWSNIPFLYMVIIVFSVIPATFSIPTRITILLVIMVLFSWTFMTYYMRTETYREKARDYALAARVLGASTPRIIFRHILPNTISTVVTFIPFTVVAAITAITALDFLGWGLPPPTPSIGELLKQGTANLTTAPWIVTSAFVALVLILTLVTFIGEAIREAFDPKKFTVYR
jgi:microcin C transport system permease protein